MNPFLELSFDKLFIILSLNLCFCDDSINSEISKVLKSYEKSGYNKDIRPHYGVKPIKVNITLQIKDISSVSEVQMDFTADFYLSQTWNDDRLVFNETKELKQLIVGADFIKKIWVPDTYFLNSKVTSLHTSTNLETSSLLRIQPNGDVFYSLRVTVVAVCQMDLKYFPLDSQTCSLEIESYGYTRDDLEYFWVADTMYDSEISLPNFNIIDHSNDKTFVVFPEGNFTRLLHRIEFDRSLGFYMNQVYIPAILIVIISWIPFWLDRDDSHARVGLGVTTVLTMTTLVTNTNAAMPKISYMKSLDIYLEVCFAMVFASLIQYAVVGYFIAYNKNKKDSDSDKKQKRGKPSEDVVPVINKSPSNIDLHSRWIFPVVFIIFNVFYWFIYLSLSKPNK